MAEEEAPVEQQEPARSGGVISAIMWSTLGLVFGAGGFAIPHLCPGLFGASGESVAEEQEETPKLAFIPFGETVVNLNSDRLNRYLRLNVTLQVKKSDEEEIIKLVENRKALLKSWLISFLSDVSMEDIRGAAGQNRLRREIQDQFNSTLFTDGYDRIRDVLFEEFNVQ